MLWLGALICALTIHEFAHAWVADYLGDPTPRLAGRLTLNPLAHLDPLGTLSLFLFKVGWGKPVPIDPYNLRFPRRDSALIALAGPASNILFAIGLGIIAKILALPGLRQFIFLNFALAFFNLLPLHPLDGGKILVGFLPFEKAEQVEEFLHHFGLLLLLFALLPIFAGWSLVELLVFPPASFLTRLLLG